MTTIQNSIAGAIALDAICRLERKLPLVAGTEKNYFKTYVIGGIASGVIDGHQVTIKHCAKRVSYRVDGRIVSLDALIATLCNV